MSEETNNIDHEALNLQEEPLEWELSEEAYLIEVLNSVSVKILSDEFYYRNKALIRNMSNDFFDRHTRQKDMPASLAGRCIEVFFSSISKFGLR